MLYIHRQGMMYIITQTMSEE